MNLLRNKTLRQSSFVLLGLLVLVYIIQYVVLEWMQERVHEAERKIEYTKKAQLANQTISLEVQHFFNGNTSIATPISAHLNDQDYRLRTLAAGGRVDNTDDFISPLSRLPRITLRALTENWKAYKSAVMSLLSSSGDSLSTSATSTARLEYEGLSLTLSNWYDKLAKDVDEQLQSRKHTLRIFNVAFLILDIALLGGLFFLFFKYVLEPTRHLLEDLTEHRQAKDIPANELGEVAKKVNETLEHLKDATEFVSAIGKGDLNISYRDHLDKNYVAGKNRLADSLIEMQAKLKALNDEEQKRQWANEGLTKFVDVMRSSNDNITMLGDKIIASLVHYTKSNQGGLYILNDEDPHDVHLELISLFAFDTKKHEQQHIKPGQGILGQAFLEKETTYLTTLPHEYIRITSGLGGANPKAVLIVPLKVDKDVYGLVELASFNEFKQHEIEFVERLGESIASTLASVKAAQKNKHLIEQFQQQTEEMRAQEEEMRQNMEELQATQEEIVRKEKNYLKRIEELEKLQKASVSLEEYESLTRRFEEKEQQLLTNLEALQKQLKEKTTVGDDWATTVELEKALRINLEAMRITQDELTKKLKNNNG